MLAAQRAFVSGDWDTDVSRAYYSVFHGVMAALDARQEIIMLPKTHAQLHGLLRNRLGMSLGILNSGEARAFRSLLRWRQTADYEPFEFDQDTAGERVISAERLNAKLAEVLRES